MSDVAIRVENLSKLYHIGVLQRRNDTLRDALSDVFHRARRSLSSGSSRSDDADLWALKDVSFEVQRGEVVGIIGRNGAGKSTLLKILSRITEPTSGQAEIHGRVGSLLEVGTGFHPELTGRENIYLNGAILGMRRTEIDRQFDEIVAFAEIEHFLDTPVKRYSSGMYVRLAFAVAAHLEPEILLVDEVLAVGDAAFQSKCLGKMEDVAKAGRTVLFVSHNMAAVLNLCERAILLGRGTIIQQGDVHLVAQDYINSLEPVDNQALSQVTDREGDGTVRFVGLKISDAAGRDILKPVCGEDMTIDLTYEAPQELSRKSVVFSIGFYNLIGQPLFMCRSDLQGTEYTNLPAQGIVSCRIRRFPLPPGRFRINLHCEANGILADWVRDALMIDVADGDFFGSGRLPARERGDLLIDHDWLAAKAT